MEYIIGNYKQAIFETETGYKVGLFRVKKASDNLTDVINHTITFTGYFTELNKEDTYRFNGEYVLHERYGLQFKVESYERIEPEEKDAIIDFLTSSFVKGCGKKTAEKIVSSLGDKALELIKKDKQNLIDIGISIKTAEKIYSSIMKYYYQDELIIYLKSLDFSVKEITRLINKYGDFTKEVVKNHLYSIDFIDFYRLDKIYFNIYDETNDMRIYACIIEAMKRKTFENGDTYSYIEEIIDKLATDFSIELDNIDDYINKLVMQDKIVIVDKNRYYLSDNYYDELYIASTLSNLAKNTSYMPEISDTLLENVDKKKYNKEQIRAIKEVFSNSFTIITGGPGTGKTTIINEIIKLYELINNIGYLSLNSKIALLAPTGRASKRMSETTNVGASTIHRYLKWNKEKNEFGVNEENPQHHSLIIVDEVSMIDNYLLASLLKGIDHNVKLVFVGDENQLPSVGPGNILSDLIQSDMFPHVRLTEIYRQSPNSYIPVLASDIKDVNTDINLEIKKDDYNFLKCSKQNIKTMLKEIIAKSVEKGLTEKDIEVLIPMYRGENGIDNINIILRSIFNPESKKKKEIQVGMITYREGDKIINLVNNIDDNIFNGDIGYIKSIHSKGEYIMDIDFYGHIIPFKREDVQTIKHAYAMSIHKSQGSEFNHVIIPLTKEFNRMLYNKLIYTGITRAKKSLVLIGDPSSFIYAINNTYSIERKTGLLDNILNNFD